MLKQLAELILCVVFLYAKKGNIEIYKNNEGCTLGINKLFGLKGHQQRINCKFIEIDIC